MDYTSLSVFIQKNGSWLGPAVLVLIAFITGWHTGRVTSPYYTSHPIVFEDRQCDKCGSSGGTEEELMALKEEGRGETTSAQAVSTPAVASVQDAPQAVASGIRFVGSINSDLYHHPDCSHAKRISSQNQIWFSSQEEAKAAGYSPSKCTRDKLGL